MVSINYLTYFFSPLWKKIQKIPNLAEKEIQVYFQNFEPSFLEYKENILSLQELERGEKFLQEKDKEFFLFGRILLRWILGRLLQVEPSCLEFENNPFGKPYLPKYPELEFNLSHSHGKYLVACNWKEPLGIDIEMIRPRLDYESLARRYFSVHEIKEYEGIPMELQELAFFSGWTRKEAYIKACGKGLALPLKDFSLSLDPRNKSIIIKKDKDSCFLPLSLLSFYPYPSFLGALVFHNSKLTIKFFSLSSIYL
ncbi:MAG: 4'-phosphopantetheinyl transferase superfamily protein [Planctomycetota bacterium]|nr:MAG: 4'-phosphopantetheinyl transferase superfamily protein [Planctomycetota bacterium]